MARTRATTSSLIAARRHPAGHLEGRAVRGSGRRGDVLASFLQSDVQGDLEAARALLSEIAAVERGAPPQPAAIGNAYSVTVSPEGVALRNVVIDDSPHQQYAFDEMRRALGTWIAAIDRARRDP